jgi:hypothetical protein
LSVKAASRFQIVLARPEPPREMLHHDLGVLLEHYPEVVMQHLARWLGAREHYLKA